MEYTCKQCAINKPDEEFYAHKQMARGRLSICKVCIRTNVRNNREAKQQYYREYDRSRQDDPIRVATRNAYAQTATGKMASRRASKAWIERNPAKYKAQTATVNAVRDGRLDRLPCEICGDAKTQAHHDDYSKPLEVRWLCVTHHSAHHKALRRAA